MAHDARTGLATLPSAGGVVPSFQDSRQWVLGSVASRSALALLLGGPGIHRGFSVSGANVVASAGTPCILALADGAGLDWWFAFTANQAIEFHASSGLLSLYAVPDLLAGVSPDAAIGGLADCTFKTAASPPAYGLLLGTGNVTASAFTDFTEDAAARVAWATLGGLAVTGKLGLFGATPAAKTAVTNLSLTVSDPPEQAEVQSIVTKLNELLDALQSYGAV